MSETATWQLRHFTEADAPSAIVAIYHSQRLRYAYWLDGNGALMCTALDDSGQPDWSSSGLLAFGCIEDWLEQIALEALARLGGTR